MPRGGGLRTGHRFPNGHNLCLSRHSPLDSSDDRYVVCTHCGHGHEVIFAPQTINQSALPGAQHLLRQREKIAERPHQRRALREIRLYVSRPDRRVHFKNAIGKFFHPHKLAHPGKTANSAVGVKAGHYFTRDGALGSNLFILGTNCFRCLDQLEKRHPMGSLAWGTIDCVLADFSADLWQQCNGVESGGYAHPLAFRFLHPHH